MPTPKKLTPLDMKKKAKNFVSWKVTQKNTTLEKEFLTHTFLDGLAFLAKIAVHAEMLGHHPTVTVSPQSVAVSLTTHECGGLSNKDFELARKIDSIIHR